MNQADNQFGKITDDARRNLEEDFEKSMSEAQTNNKHEIIQKQIKNLKGIFKTTPRYRDEYYKLNAMLQMSINLVDENDESYSPMHKRTL